MSLVSIDQIAVDLKPHLRRSQENFLVRSVHVDDIPIDELAVLCKYFSIKFVLAMFGGKVMPVRIKVNNYFKEKKIEEELEEQYDDGSFVSKEPSGMGGWRYADRLQEKVFRELEKVVNQGTSGTGQQLVNASRLLIVELTKVKDSSVELMEAYEKQLIILAEFFVEKYLPKLGGRIKKELKQDVELILSKVTEAGKDDAIEVIMEGLNKLVRKWNIKRYELLIAELLAEDNETSAAFNFTTEMVHTFLKEKHVSLADESALVIAKAQERRGRI